jgi:diguanylate cyclase (GGDEF)-like protein
MPVSDHNAAAEGAEGRLVYLVENLASLHAAQNMAWIASRFEFLGEKAIGASLTALALSDDTGAYRAVASASPRPAAARDLWEALDIDGLAERTTAAAVFGEIEAHGRAADYALTDLFPGCERAGSKRALVAPVSFNREMIGVGLFVVEPEQLTDAMATMLASHAAVAIHQLRERDEARRLHSVDPRLWVPDEAFLVAQLRREIARARRYGRQVGVAVLRFANERDVRTRFGDFYTDHVLRRIGSQLLADVRDSDVVGTLNGGYAVIHTETSLEGTQLSSGRLRDKVLQVIAQRFPELTEAEITVNAVGYPETAATVEDLIAKLTDAGSSEGTALAAA